MPFYVFGSKQICKRDITLAYSGDVRAAYLSRVRRVLRAERRWYGVAAAGGEDGDSRSKGLRFWCELFFAA